MLWVGWNRPEGRLVATLGWPTKPLIPRLDNTKTPGLAPKGLGFQVPIAKRFHGTGRSQPSCRIAPATFRWQLDDRKPLFWSKSPTFPWFGTRSVAMQPHQLPNKGSGWHRSLPLYPTKEDRPTLGPSHHTGSCCDSCCYFSNQPLFSNN